MTVFKRFRKEPATLFDVPPMPPLCWVPLVSSGKYPSLEEGVVASVSCKNGHCCSLRTPPFTVSPEGIVNPSIACPACNGHEPPGSVLEEWP